MKKNYKNKFLGMSLVTAMLLGSSAYAGKIIGANPTDEVLPLTQFGFGGWYFGDDNIEVAMVAADGNPAYSTTFDQADGTYPAMSKGDSFVSSIYDDINKGTLLATVGGKDYPVGEPAGIKVINGDTLTNNGKPENCIMTTSYLEEAYLNTANPEPVICSSGFQTHKRFKVKMLPAMVNGDGELGNPVELKFNLDPNDLSTGIVRYQVFQKINNYTGKRLNGYTLEVLDANGNPNPNLTLSLGYGENPDTSGPDIFDYNTLANFAHGLWGPVDQHFPEPGFFDDVRVYYPVTLNDNNITYNGPLLGGNYQDLFGNWLTNAWAPTGIFWDDDMDPSTDAELMAYWGDPLKTGTLGWHKGKAENWAVPTRAELLAWEVSPWYSMGLIEDVLNLGLNYIVEIGENASIGDTFTIRITPHTDSDQTVPSHVGTTPTVIIPTSVGTVAITPSPTFIPGEELIVAVADTDLNTDYTTEQNITIVVKNSTGDEENVVLVETDVNSSIFTGTLPTDSINVGGVNDGTMTAVVGTIVTAYYTDESESNAIRTASTTAVAITPPTDDENPSSGGGGGCTYNPDSKNFDMTLLLMMALGLLYPLRRRFIK